MAGTIENAVQDVNCDSLALALVIALCPSGWAAHCSEHDGKNQVAPQDPGCSSTDLRQ
jgi:hypothetical protein